MNNLSRRIERLEGKLGLKRGPRHLLITNVDATGDKAGEFLPGLYVDVWGEPLNPDEIEELKKTISPR